MHILHIVSSISQLFPAAIRFQILSIPSLATLAIGQTRIIMITSQNDTAQQSETLSQHYTIAHFTIGTNLDRIFSLQDRLLYFSCLLLVFHGGSVTLHQLEAMLVFVRFQMW